MSLASGTILGNYEILEQVGAGGIGEVHRARDTKLERDVAIKVIPDEFTWVHELQLAFVAGHRFVVVENLAQVSGVYVGHAGQI